MGFKPGNTESSKADHKKPRVITQHLIAALNETDAENVTKMRRMVEKLIDLALGGDMQAIKEIGDRVEGKPVQAVDLSGEVSYAYVARMPSKAASTDQWLNESRSLSGSPKPAPSQH